MGELLSKPVTETATGMAKSATLFQTLASMQGYRVSNEDSHQALLDLAPSVSYFGVFDGHNGTSLMACPFPEAPISQRFLFLTFFFCRR